MFKTAIAFFSSSVHADLGKLCKILGLCGNFAFPNTINLACSKTTYQCKWFLCILCYCSSRLARLLIYDCHVNTGCGKLGTANPRQVKNYLSNKNNPLFRSFQFPLMLLLRILRLPANYKACFIRLQCCQSKFLVFLDKNEKNSLELYARIRRNIVESEAKRLRASFFRQP